MSGSVERWLGTFMCKQYAYLFEEYGFKTLQQVCQLQRPTLHSMGIPPDQCEKILENVNVLRQSLLASSPEHMGSHDASFPPPSYGMRHNMHSPHYPGSTGPGCTYQDHPYENQMGNHNQSNNYNYHPSSPYPPVSPSPQQYSGHGSQLHSSVPYSNSQAYTGSQGTQYTNQEVYGQQLGYNSRIHQSQLGWESNPSHDLRTYNQSPRTVIGSSPPPSVMRSPPPGPGMAMSHYRQMMMNNLAEQPPHSWSQSQIPSPGMMHSPRTTPSPGMGHAAGNLTSPALPNRSPAHKPFSPPPFTSHGPPPPAHQQSMNNYEYPGNHPVSPAAMTPNRSMPSPSNQNPPARNNATDPLQSLQKMVLLEGQAMVPTYASPGAEQQSTNLQKPGSSFGIEQLVAKEANATLNSSSPSSLSSSSSVSQPQKFPKQESEHVTNVSSRDSEQTEIKEETSENVLPPVVGENSQSTSSSSQQITPSSASSPQNKELLTNDGNSFNPQSTAIASMHKCSNEISSTRQSTSEIRTDSVPVLATSSNHSNGSSPIMQPPRNRWKNSSVGMVNSDFELASKEKFYPPPEQNHIDGGNIINMDAAPVSNGQGPNSIHNEESVMEDPYVIMKNQKYRKMVDAQANFERQEHLPNSYIARNNDGLGYRDVQQPEFQNNMVASVRKMRYPRKLRGRKAAMAGRMENHHVNNYPYPTDNSMEGEQVQHYYENNQMENVMKKCRGPVIHMGAKPSVYVDSNSSPDMSVNYMPMRPPYKKPSYLSLNAPSYNYNMSDNETAVHISDSDSVSKPMSFSPMRTNMSQVPNQLLTLGNAIPSVKLTDCSKRIKEELKVNSYVSAENMSSNRLSESPRMSSDGYLKVNCSSGTDTSMGDGSLSPPKKRRGRPPGSKNKPKPPGFEKEKKKKKAPESPSSTPEKQLGKKRKIEEKKPDVPVSAKLRGPYIHVDCSENQPLVKIVNTANKDEEMDSKGFKKKKIHNREGSNVMNSGFTKRKLAKIGFTSTLSAKYDAVTKDKTWICALCHNGSHYQGLGDLFGPYFENRLTPEVSARDKPNSLPDSKQPAENSELSARNVRAKRKRSEWVEEFLKSSMAKKGKRSKEVVKEEVAEPTERGDASASTTEAEPSNGPKEIWVHEDCIVWSHGVYLVGNKICGMQEAARVSADMECCKCKETGATLGCFNKGCTEQYHYICAVEKGCQLDEANYSMLCPKHKKKTRVLS